MEEEKKKHARKKSTVSKKKPKNVEEPKVEEALVEEQTIEEPKVEETVVEEQVIEEPKVEEIAVEEPKVEIIEESTSEIINDKKLDFDIEQHYHDIEKDYPTLHSNNIGLTLSRIKKLKK
jgi:hypothetical protein